MMPLLGERVVVAGSSMGGLRHLPGRRIPGRVAALVLARPFTISRRLRRSCSIIRAEQHWSSSCRGKCAGGPPIPRIRRNGRSTAVEKYYSSFKSAADMVKRAARESVYRKITDPVLMLYYTTTRKTRTLRPVSPRLKRAFDLFGKDAKPNPLNRAWPFRKPRMSALKMGGIGQGQGGKEIVEFLLRIE